MMHVCYLCNEYPPNRGGGIGSFTRNLSQAIVAKGHCVDVIGIYRQDVIGRSVDQGLSVHRLPAARIPLTRFWLNGRRLLRGLKDIALSGELAVIEGQENAFASFSWKGPAKKIIRMHGGHHFFARTLGRRPAIWRGWQERRSFEQADAICAVSRYVAETTRELLGLGGREISILPNFVDPHRFCPRPSGRRESGLIVFAGTVCEKKGIRQLIQAMAEIKSRVPAARLAVLGRDLIEPSVGGSFTAYLQSRIPASLANSIEFLGAVPQEQLIEYLARAEVCVYPSHMEAMPMAWLEAMSMGKAVVGSLTGPGPEVIEQNVSGLLCDPHDPDSIAAEVLKCLNDAGLRQRLGAAARQRVLERFSVERMADRNLEFYEQVVAGKAA
jgi:glycosyltransferase involved in cell wall biosynthesis